MKSKIIIIWFLIILIIFNIVRISFLVYKDPNVISIESLLKTSNPVETVVNQNELAKDWFGFNAFLNINKVATSTYGDSAICRIVSGHENDSFFAFRPIEIVMFEAKSKKTTIIKDYHMCPFKWVGNTIYAAVRGHESPSDIYKIEVKEDYTLGAATFLDFDNYGKVDITNRYYAFSNAIQHEGFDKDIRFCDANEMIPACKRSDQLGFIDFETGKVLILLADKNKVFYPDGWSRDSTKILYREYIIPELNIMYGGPYSPSPELGKRYSINIYTKEIKREELLDDVFIW